MEEFYIIFILLLLPNFTDCEIFRANEHKMAENALSHMRLKLILTECTGFLCHFTLHKEQDDVLSGSRWSSIIFCFSVFNSAGQAKWRYASKVYVLYICLWVYNVYTTPPQGEKSKQKYICTSVSFLYKCPFSLFEVRLVFRSVSLLCELNDKPHEIFKEIQYFSTKI
jgi:hypothetical protein